MGVVLHIGRKTRRQYHTPVLVFWRGNRLIIALTYGRESQWVRNVLAEDGCELDTESVGYNFHIPISSTTSIVELCPPSLGSC